MEVNTADHQRNMRSHVTKSDLIYRVLKAQILKGELRPGDRIKTTVVARAYGVSETPVREALRRLEAEELVTVQPHVGARVIAPDITKLTEIAIICFELECLATRLVAARATPELCARLDTLVNAMDAAIKRGDPIEYSNLNRDFHLNIYRASGYQELVRLIESLRVKIEHLNYVFSQSTEAMVRSNETHRELVHALRQRDPLRAESLTRAQKEAALRRYQELWQDLQGEKVNSNVFKNPPVKNRSAI